LTHLSRTLRHELKQWFPGFRGFVDREAHDLPRRAPGSYDGSNQAAVIAGQSGETSGRNESRDQLSDPLSPPRNMADEDPDLALRLAIKDAVDRGNFDRAAKLLEILRATATPPAPSTAPVVDLASRRTRRE
jgi:hypothetical protein